MIYFRRYNGKEVKMSGTEIKATNLPYNYGTMLNEKSKRLLNTKNWKEIARTHKQRRKFSSQDFVFDHFIKLSSLLYVQFFEHGEKACRVFHNVDGIHRHHLIL